MDVVRGRTTSLDLFTCVLRFSSTEAMQRWLDSPQRMQLVNEAAPMLADGDQTEVNPVNEFWFAPTGRQRAATATALEAGGRHAVGDPAAHLAGAVYLGARSCGLNAVPVQLRGLHASWSR